MLANLPKLVVAHILWRISILEKFGCEVVLLEELHVVPNQDFACAASSAVAEHHGRCMRTACGRVCGSSVFAGFSTIHSTASGALGTVAFLAIKMKDFG